MSPVNQRTDHEVGKHVKEPCDNYDDTKSCGRYVHHVSEEVCGQRDGQVVEHAAAAAFAYEVCELFLEGDTPSDFCA